jgi:hypothetical protein
VCSDLHGGHVRHHHQCACEDGLVAGLGQLHDLVTKDVLRV